MDIKDFRAEIDRVDREITRLFCERMRIAAGIAEYKRNNNLPVLDAVREKAKLESVAEMTEPEMREYVKTLYTHIFEISREYQHKLNDKRYGLIGEKLEHSYSPEIHALIGKYEYNLYPMPREKIADFFMKCELNGYNVTIPYKETVMPYLDEISDEARKIGCVNTVAREKDGKLKGYNTDYYGFSEMLGNVESFRGKKALVLGSGGASKTVCAVLNDMGIETVVISRKGENNYKNLIRHADASLIVNATPVGMYPNVNGAPIDLRLFPNCSLVLDLIYNPAKTELILQAEDLGIECRSGMAMLAAQAVKAAEIWGEIAQNSADWREISDAVERKNRSIALIGMPGCGKTSVGSELARITGRKFFDIDAEIVKETGMDIPTLFEKCGEAEFRKIETSILDKFSVESRAVIATGGGIVTVLENRRLLRRNSHVIYLKRNIDELPIGGRPVSAARGVKEIYAERAPKYEEWSEIAFENIGIGETAAQIAAWIGK